MPSLGRAFTALVSAALVTGAEPAGAQWPDRTVANAPRTADGAIDMDGPVPRTPDGRPDLSGIWENVGAGQGAEPERLGPDGKPFATFRDIGAGFRDGLPLRPWAKELLDERVANNAKDNPDVWCQPMGNQQFQMHPFPRKIIQAPDLVLLLYETHQGIRQIHLDGRTLPDPADDPHPWWYGYSVGRWEGDTLVVETAHFRDLGWLDINGSPITTEGRTIERFTRTSYGTIEIEQTVDDPKAYTRPFTTRMRWRLMPGTELIEMICGENNQSINHLVGADGTLDTAPPE